MRRARSVYEVFSLSAIDLFASAMGAFVVLTIILMPDYQKEVRAEEDLKYLETLAGETEAILEDTQAGREDTLKAMAAAMARYQRLTGEFARLSSERDVRDAELQARFDNLPPPKPSPVERTEALASMEATFRFLGLKTDRTRIVFLVDMNRYLAPHAGLVTDTVLRALGGLEADYGFAIVGFQRLDEGTRYHRWPEDGGLAAATPGNTRRAGAFLEGLEDQYRGASSVLDAARTALAMPGDAIVLFSDGLPNPDVNGGLTPTQLVGRIASLNRDSKEIHAVTIGDYFKYRGTVEFMESLAQANGGGFLALAD